MFCFVLLHLNFVLCYVEHSAAQRSTTRITQLVICRDVADRLVLYCMRLPSTVLSCSVQCCGVLRRIWFYRMKGASTT